MWQIQVLLFGTFWNLKKYISHLRLVEPEDVGGTHRYGVPIVYFPPPSTVSKSVNLFFHTHTHTHTCVCVCVCVCLYGFFLSYNTHSFSSLVLPHLASESLKIQKELRLGHPDPQISHFETSSREDISSTSCLYSTLIVLTLKK